jgi:hypothetical protein
MVFEADAFYFRMAGTLKTSRKEHDDEQNVVR